MVPRFQIVLLYFVNKIDFIRSDLSIKSFFSSIINFDYYSEGYYYEGYYFVSYHERDSDNQARSLLINSREIMFASLQWAGFSHIYISRGYHVISTNILSMTYTLFYGFRYFLKENLFIPKNIRWKKYSVQVQIKTLLGP